MTPEEQLINIQNFKGKYPKQLWYLFLSEMWERFCFYGMRGMLTVFMVSQLAVDEKTANLRYGAIQAFVYAFTFVGGIFADKILGFRKSLFWGGILMISGSIILAIDPRRPKRAGNPRWFPSTRQYVVAGGASPPQRGLRTDSHS